MTSRVCLILSLILAGCTEDATQIVVAIGSDLSVPDELGFVRVARCTAGSRPADVLSASCSHHDFDLRAGQSLPFSLTLGANDDRLSERITVIALGYGARPGASDPFLVARVTDAQFRPNQTLGLPLFLYGDCGTACMSPGGPAACCGDVSLVPVRPGNELSLLDGGVAPPPLDGGDTCSVDDDCDDGDPCSDDHCESGRCGESTPKVCPDEDGNPCTLEACEPGSGECSASPAPDGTECSDGAGACCSAECVELDTSSAHCGACDAACDDNELCASGTCACAEGYEDCGGACVLTDADPAHCGRCDNACEGDTPACMDGTCGMCAVDSDCAGDDGRDCTTSSPTCVMGACVYPLEPDTCLIDGACHADGERNSANDCEACDPATDTSAWTRRASGQTCDDGLFCTEGTTCSAAGACVGGSATDCDDGLSCTSDSCDDGAGACINAIIAGRCLLDDACFNAGQRNPADQCEECDPATPTSWHAAIGEICDDGLLCTVNDVCRPAGSCGGDPNPCSDTLACTDDSCDTVMDRCVNAPRDDTGDGLADWCVIGTGPSATCIAAGASMGTNTCTTCDPTTSTTSLTPLMNETMCTTTAAPPMNLGHCCAGVCQPINSTQHCLTCGNACSAGQVCAAYGMMPPDFRCCTSGCPPG